MSTGSAVQPIGLHKKDQKLFEFFEKILTREGPMDLSGQKVKEYTNRFSKDFHRRIHYFGGLGRFLSSDPRFCVSLNVVRLATPMKPSILTPMKPSIPTPGKQINERELKQNVTGCLQEMPTGNPWKIDPPSHYKKSSNASQFRLAPGDTDFSPLLRNIISIKSSENKHTLPVSENVNRQQVRLLGNYTRDNIQIEEPRQLVQTRDGGCSASHGVPLQATSSLGHGDWLQPMVQDTSTSVPLQLAQREDSQTQVRDTEEESLDQRSDKLYFPSAYDRTELDTTSLITEFAESLSSSQSASSSEEETVPQPQADNASLLLGRFMRWSPTEQHLINSLEAGLSANSTVLLPINSSAMIGFPANWPPIRDPHMKWPPIKGLPMSWSQIIARPEKSFPGPTMDSSVEFAESRSPTVGFTETRSQTGLVDSRSKITRHTSRSPTGLPENRSPTGMPESRSPAGLPESRSPAGLPESRSPTGFPEGRSPTGLPESRSPAGFPEGRSPTGFPESRLPTGFPESRSQTGFPEGRSPAGFPEGRSPTGFTEGRSPTGFTEGRSPTGFTEGRSPAGFTENRSPAGFTENRSHAGLTENRSYTPRFTESWTRSTTLSESSPSRGPNDCLSPRFPSPSMGLFDNQSTVISDDSSSTVLYGNLSGTESCETSPPTTRRPVHSSPSRGLPISSSPVGLGTNSTPKDLALNSTTRLTMNSSLTSELPMNSPPSGLTDQHLYLSAVNEHTLHSNSMNDFVSPAKTVLEKRSQNCSESPYENGSYEFNSDQTKHSRQSLFQLLEPAGCNLDQSSYDQWSIGKIESINTIMSLPNIISEINLILTDFKNRICALNIPTLHQNSFSAEYAKDSGHKVMSSEAVYRLENLSEGNSQYPNSGCVSFSGAPGYNCQNSQVHGKLDYQSAQGMIGVEIETDIDGTVHNGREFRAVGPQIDINGAVDNDGEFTVGESQTYINGKVDNKIEFTSVNLQTNVNGIHNEEFTGVEPQTYIGETVKDENELIPLETRPYINGTVDNGIELKPAETQTYISETVGNEDEFKAVKMHIDINGAVGNERKLRSSNTQTDVISTLDNRCEFKGVKIQIDISGTVGNGRKFPIEHQTDIDGSVNNKELKAVVTQTDIDGMVHNEREFTDNETQTDINETVDERELNELNVVDIQTDISGTDIDEQFAQINYLKEVQTICRIEYQELLKEQDATKGVVKTLQERLKNLQEELDLTKFENDDLERQVTYLLEKNERADENDFDCVVITNKLLKTHHEVDMADVKLLPNRKSKKKRKGRK